MSIKIYCSSCATDQEFVIEPMERKSQSATSSVTIWGDIRCKECDFVIGTITAEEEGIYDLVKVGELP